METRESSAFNSNHGGCYACPPVREKACILAIAKYVPQHKIIQKDYTDFYFKITNCDHKVDLKQKMARICEKSGIHTRHSIMTEDFLKAHPKLYTPGEPSLELRHKFLAEEVPRLAHKAALKALEEWGRPTSLITHLVVATISGVAMPGADVTMVKSLGLRPDVKRIMLYMLGCYAGVTALRVAKDLAENNPGSRVLICCSEVSATTFRAPDEKSPYSLVGAALFGDGAVGVIVGTKPNSEHLIDPSLSLDHTYSHDHLHMDRSSKPYLNYQSSHIINHPTNYTFSNSKPSLQLKGIINPSNGQYNPIDNNHLANNMMKPSNGLNHPNPNNHNNYLTTITSLANKQPFKPEHPIYEIHTTTETIIPQTENIIQGNLELEGLRFYLDRELPNLISKNVVEFCEGLLKEVTPQETSMQDIFWAIHAGGPAILNAVEKAAKLHVDQLAPSRHVLSKYGNVSASTVLFVLDEIRRISPSKEHEWGIALAFGPGVTFEGVLLRRL